MGREVSQGELSEILGLTTRQLRNLEEVGMPARAEGNRKWYPLPDAVRWYVDRQVQLAVDAAKPTDRAEADTRKAKAQARRAELEAEEMEGRLIRLEHHERVLGEVLGEVRSNLLNIPGSVAVDLVGLETEREIVDVLQPAVDRCLTRLIAVADEVEQRGVEVEAT